MATEHDLVTTEDREPWERMPTEDQRDYLAFCVYRNLGPSRTYAAVARELTMAPATISRLANQFEWADRADAFDYYQDRIFQAELAERQRHMAREHLDMTQNALKALMAPVTAVLNKWEVNPEETLAELGAKDIAKLMKIAQDSIRLIPSLLAAERSTMAQPSQTIERLETENLNYGDAERIGDVLTILRDIGVLDAFLDSEGSGEIIDAEVVEVDDDRTEPETDSLPPGRP